jgi:Tfp pilus assembly PilM family ATPase/Tfp pilus assembly protein PilN
MYVTLNIGASRLRVLSVKGRQVRNWGSLPLSAGLVRDGLILQPEAVGEAIDALFKATKVPKERVITSLTGLSFTYRFLSLPRMKPAILEEAIQRAAKKEIPLPLDELYLSWQPIGAKGDEQEFFVLGVSRNLIDTLVQTLAVAGVAPYLMDLTPLALTRAANRTSAIIANLEPDCFDIVLVAEGIPAILHTLSPRGEGATLEDNIQRLTDELSRTVGFYQSQHPENSFSPATPLLLSGELATEATTRGLLQAETEYPVENLVPPLEFPPDLPVASYAANMGLALKKMPQKMTAKGRDARCHDININLLSGKYRKARARPLPPGYMFVIIFLIMAVGLLFPFYQAKSQLDADNTRLRDDLDKVSRELNLARLAAEETTRTEETIREITARAEAVKQELQSLLGTRGDLTSHLVLVAEALPPQAYLTSIEISPELITVQGEADSPFTVVSYATNLEAKETFHEVRITDIDETTAIKVENAESEATTPERWVITFEIIMKK